eukprot:CAMPEP_0197187056 /NCGR_PEP_ID=MMETSP1423-20130617/15143_1 /TAXON_ID=476441 /ORGANISM="Pseudo-nitzschia heimii, Strain UNC1101" /LENGTH=149 /DNA_ID=CAMNT_0042638535 /DNA_START=9 /DNA_END=458 /DNA_ORIENTATION=+
MRIQGDNSLALFLLAAFSVGVVSGFQHTVRPLRTTPHTTISVTAAVRSPMILRLNTPPQYDYDDDDFDATPFGDSTGGEPPLPTQGIPKLKLPTPSFSMPEIDFKDVLKRVAALAVTAVAFVVIQKLGMAASEIFTPELTAEQVKNYQY